MKGERRNDCIVVRVDGRDGVETVVVRVNGLASMPHEQFKRLVEEALYEHRAVRRDAYNGPPLHF